MVQPRGGAASPFVARAYVHNPANHLAVGVRYPRIVPHGDIYVYAYPKNQGLAVTSDKPILAQVTRPDGGHDTLELFDRGRDAAGHGDDVPGDGVFTGVYKATAQSGPYQFLLQADIENWIVSADAHEYKQEGPSIRFVREARLSTAVHDPRQVETTPEDDKPVVVADGLPCERYLCILLYALLIFLILNVIALIFCWFGRRNKNSCA